VEDAPPGRVVVCVRARPGLGNGADKTRDGVDGRPVGPAAFTATPPPTPKQQCNARRGSGKEQAMSTVRGILQTKGTHIHSIGKDATVLQAVLLMREHGIGCLVVLDQDRVAGIFTERDALWRVMAEGRDPGRTSVGEVMTEEVVGCTPETPLEEARSAMKTRKLRHLPVMDGGQGLAGLISIGDLNAHLAADQERTIYTMHEYLYGRV
jgi:CBS domain-containing protein